VNFRRVGRAAVVFSLQRLRLGIRATVVIYGGKRRICISDLATCKRRAFQRTERNEIIYIYIYISRRVLAAYPNARKLRDFFARYRTFVSIVEYPRAKWIARCFAAEMPHVILVERDYASVSSLKHRCLVVSPLRTPRVHVAIFRASERECSRERSNANTGERTARQRSETGLGPAFTFTTRLIES